MGYSLTPGLFIIENIKISALFPMCGFLNSDSCLKLSQSAFCLCLGLSVTKNCSLLNPVSPLTLPFIGLLQSIKPKKVFNISVETRNFSETVAEISYALYGKIYDKLEDSFATQAEIIHLAIQFEREHDWLYEDFLDEMEKFTRQQLQKYESNES